MMRSYMQLILASGCWFFVPSVCRLCERVFALAPGIGGRVHCAAFDRSLDRPDSPDSPDAGSEVRSGRRHGGGRSR